MRPSSLLSLAAAVAVASIGVPPSASAFAPIVARPAFFGGRAASSSSSLSATVEAPTAAAASLDDATLDADLSSCIAALDRRLEKGPGSLDAEEVGRVSDAVDRIVEATKAAAANKSSDAAPSGVAAPVAPIPIATPSEEDRLRLQTAALQMDVPTLKEMLARGYTMDEEAAEAAFWATVNAVDRAEALDQPLSADVPRMLHMIFDADLHNLHGREQIRTNVTCMQPDSNADFQGRMNYVFDDSCAKDLPLMEGRKCEGGTCCDECSRNLFPTFALENEVDFDKFPDMMSLTFNELETVPAATILQFVRLVERVRRTIAYEWGLDLKTILPLQAYSRKYVAGTTQKGGGGGEGDFVILHTDEGTHDGYHYSCVLYLSTQGEDFEGGDFVWNDPAPKGEGGPTIAYDDEDSPYASLEDEIRRAGRKLTPYSPTRGSAVIFSSGWENMHEVEKITSGVRYCVPAFFTTCPVPDAAYDQMHVGKPKTDEDIADDWLHLLLAHRKEEPVESVGRVKELLMKWHVMCAPLDMH